MGAAGAVAAVQGPGRDTHGPGGGCGCGAAVIDASVGCAVKPSWGKARLGGEAAVLGDPRHDAEGGAQTDHVEDQREWRAAVDGLLGVDQMGGGSADQGLGLVGLRRRGAHHADALCVGPGEVGAAGAGRGRPAPAGGRLTKECGEPHSGSRVREPVRSFRDGRFGRTGAEPPDGAAGGVRRERPGPAAASGEHTEGCARRWTGDEPARRRPGSRARGTTKTPAAAQSGVCRACSRGCGLARPAVGRTRVQVREGCLRLLEQEGLVLPEVRGLEGVRLRTGGRCGGLARRPFRGGEQRGRVDERSPIRCGAMKGSGMS